MITPIVMMPMNMLIHMRPSMSTKRPVTVLEYSVVFAIAMVMAMGMRTQAIRWWKQAMTVTTPIYVHPQQMICEVGDQIDSDCNGNVNTAEYQDGFILDTNGQGSLLYVDADGDGFGDSEIVATPACEVSSGFVFNATDCNDEDSTINPNSKEICDGIDQDCDLTIDEPDSLDDPAVSKCTYMYRDVDADSYGDADYSACLCQEGSNPSVTYNDYEYVIYSGDCYDYNADIKPLSCSDGIDQDDDGFVDDEDPNCIAGFQEGSDTIKEEAFELLDGHDNNCDGLVAAVRL